MTFDPTPEQAHILTTANATSAHLLISALAGCAKTTTLVLLAKSLRPRKPILSLAFNKRIALEMRERMPGHVECSTLNALGHRAWGTKLDLRLTLAAEKQSDNLKAYIDSQPKAAQRALWDDFGEIKRSIDTARTRALLPDEVGEHCISEGLANLSIETAVDLVRRLLAQSIAQAQEGRIDFLDQLYMPTLFGATYPAYPYVFVDEAQDLSPLNHLMLRQIVPPSGRLIAVGDPHQSIYGFRGAVSNGMDTLRDDWSMTILPLSVTFRCPQALVRRAQRRVPHFRWAPSAPVGEIINLTSWETRADLAESETTEGAFTLWTPAGVPDGAAIICRNNAPLFRVALTLLRARRGINLVGFDLGPQLLKVMRKLGALSMDSAESLAALEVWTAAQIKRRPSTESATHDRAECIAVFLEGAPTLGEAILAAEDVFAAKGPIQLLSGHKSKGLEWDTVYHLDPWRVPSRRAEPGTEDYEQELNIRYVIETRAKSRLILANAEDFQ